jgi:hypothetical protein
MPGTKRVPLARSHTLSLQHVLPLYRHALRARTKWRRTRNDADYSELIEAQKNCDRALGTRLWQVSIFDFDDLHNRNAPPDYMGPRRREDWYRALELRQALEQLDREQQQQQRKAREAQRTEPEREREQPTPPPSS